jgi:hypothetical protein
MVRIYDKRPREKRKRSHYNKKGIAKQPFDSAVEAVAYIERKRLDGYVAYFCHECDHWHIGRTK